MKLHAPLKFRSYRLLHYWRECEGGTACFNPLNTTETWPGATDYNSVGVKNYPNSGAGIDATYVTLTNGHYPGIVSGLRAGIDPKIIVTKYADEFDTWGTGTTCLRNFLGIK